jgi:hypothetical protein
MSQSSAETLVGRVAAEYHPGRAGNGLDRGEGALRLPTVCIVTHEHCVSRTATDLGDPLKIGSDRHDPVGPEPVLEGGSKTIDIADD